MAQPRKGYLPTLDGWRAIAILAVIVDHTVAYHFRETLPWLIPFTRIGPNGVSLFFAISGFLICSRLLEEETLFGRISLKGFYVRRAFRILPAAMAYLLVIGLLGVLGYILVDPRDWWSSVLFFRNYLPPSWIHRGWGGYTVHYWSLAVEEHFYLLWPALLAFSGKKRARTWAIALALVISLWRWWDFHHQWMERVLPGLLFPSRTDVRLDALLLGCLVALLLDDVRWRERADRWFTFLPWLACVLAYCMFTVLARQHVYSIWESLLLPMIVAGTVIRPGMAVSRWLEHPALRWIGRLSYSLYLWQQFFAMEGARYPFAWLQAFPVNLALLFGMAALSYQLLERPMIRWGHRLAPPPTPGREDLREGVMKTSAGVIGAA